MAGSVRSEAYQRLIRALVALRVDAGLSQAQVAARLGKPPSFVGKYELGERRLDVVEVFVVLKAFGADPLIFLSETLGPLPTRL